MAYIFTDQVALVFGGAGGIGSAVCRSLAAHGASVAVIDLDSDRAEKVAASLSEVGGWRGKEERHRGRAADVTSSDSVGDAVESMREELGVPSILVNCAGYPKDSRITEMTDSEWDEVLAVSLYGTFVTCRAVAPMMKEAQYGRIVNISSRAHWGNPGQANYSAAKAGIIGLTRSLAQELGRYKITANALAPGLIDTPAVRQLEKFDLIKDLYIERASIKRIGSPADVAHAVSFLAHPDSSLITGELIHISGGRYG